MPTRPEGGDGGVGIALTVHDLRAAKSSLELLESDVLCGVGQAFEVDRRISVEEKDAIIAKYTSDMFNKSGLQCRGNRERHETEVTSRYFTGTGTDAS